MSARVRIALASIAALAMLAPVGSRAGAQDIEAVAAITGRSLPTAYHERVRRDPRAFEYPEVWGGRRARGFPHTADPTAPLRAALGAPAAAGTMPVLVIPALFSDSREPGDVLSHDVLQHALFEGPYNIPALYAEMSRGALTMRGRVTPWVRTGLTLAETVGNANGLGGTNRMGEWLVESVRAVDPIVDFGEYDNDGPDGVPNSGDDDGVVDALAFLFIEGAASCGGPGIWPHRSAIQGWTGSALATDDRRPDGTPVMANGYIVQDATNCTGTRPLNSTTVAHELGHVLGLPDLYHGAFGIGPGARRWVVGCWDLMAAGSWGCGAGDALPRANIPTHMGAWSKGQLGWVTPQYVPADVRDREYVLRPAIASGDVLRITLGVTEFLDLEYRRRESFDVELPASGVLVYHIDEGRTQSPCISCPPIYRVSLVEADGDGALLRLASEGGNRGVAGDAFGRLAGQVVTSATTPSTRTNLGTPSTVAIHSFVIDEAAGVARVRLTTAAQPLVAAAPIAEASAATQVRREVRATGGAHPYAWTVTGALPAGLTATPGAESLVIAGVPLAAGSFPITVTVRDAAGLESAQAFTVVVREPTFAQARLLQPFTRAAGVEALTPEEVQYLDNLGNRNGRYDVGDLRAYRRTVASR